MSPRITRSSARQAAKQADQSPSSTASTAKSNPLPATAAPADSVAASSRKRKTEQTSPPRSGKGNPETSGRRSKKQKTAATGVAAADTSKLPKRNSKKGKNLGTMDSQDGFPPAQNSSEQVTQSSSSSRKSSRSKKPAGTSGSSSAGPSSSTRRNKRNTNPSNEDTAMTGTNDEKGSSPGPPAPPTADTHPSQHHDSSDDDEGDDDDDDDGRYDDEIDFFGGPGAAGLSGTLRALTGMMSGFTSRLRDLLNNLRQDDLSVQMIALQELSEILLVSNEDNLSGHFSPDQFVKELVPLMNKEESPEVMLLSCRCLANLMEALPASVANVVYGGAVPVLCSKLLEISFIDLAEQSLSTLEKISYEYPASIIREGGLTACLSYLDFFPTSTQRTAVTIAANCCRNIPDDSFTTVRDVMPTLLNVLGSSDQRVVEQASLCVSGIVDAFGHQPKKLEELVSVDLLRAVLRLLVPGTSNLVGSNIHTQFLRVLTLTARASPRLSAELLKLNIVDTVYQMLTGVSPPAGTEDVASKLDSVVIMQALIHRPREQILETLNVVCELLPSLPKTADNEVTDIVTSSTTDRGSRHRHRKVALNNEKRIELLKGCPAEVRRFALILFPTLTDAYSSTVNLGVRQRVLTAQLKMLSNLDQAILSEALIPVPYASFLASILSQQDNPALVLLGLQGAELLLNRLGSIYRYQFYREGVFSEITALANQEVPEDTNKAKSEQGDRTGAQRSNEGHREDQVMNDSTNSAADEDTSDDDGGDEDHHEDQDEDGKEDEDDEDEDDDDEEDPEERHMDGGSQRSSRASTMSVDPPIAHPALNARSLKDVIRQTAKKFVETHERQDAVKQDKEKANEILGDLTSLAGDLESFYVNRTASDLRPSRGKELLHKLASHFDSNVLESITSAELLASGLVRVLLAIFSNPDQNLTREAQSNFLEVFMGYNVRSRPKTATADSPVTPFSIMVHKLQDLLSRSEHFEVLTVHQNAFDGNRSNPASMLGKQIRIRLTADDESDIPKPYRNIMVTIQAIATLKSLEEYLRPRIVPVSDRHRARRDDLSRALAAMASAGGLPYAGASADSRLAGMGFGSALLTGAGPPPPPPVPAPGSTSTSTPAKSSRKAHRRPAAQGDETPTGTLGNARRSSRQQPATEGAHTAQPPTADGDRPQDTLECADEKQLTDDEDDSMADDDALDALVGELEDEMDDEDGDDDVPAQDPSAVNVEVATGGKVTARKESGSRVPTPRAPQDLAARPAFPWSASTQGGARGTPSPSASSAARASYASALQSTPDDWYIEFSLDGKTLPNWMTVYRAVHNSVTASQNPQQPGVGRSLWSSTFTISFKKVPGPPPPGEPQSSTQSGCSEGGLPASLTKYPTTNSILQLLNVLHDLNANVEDVLLENRGTTIDLQREPLSQFVNTKLTAKLNRQLEEPLIVASNCLPGWSEDLARLYPFLFPFETRHLFLQSTSFGYARSMAKWQSTQANDNDNRRDRMNDRPPLGRMQRQKVRISRGMILEAAIKVMDLYGASQSILEVEYFEEVGTGLGPTLEFYSTVSREFSKKKLTLWRDSDTHESSDFVQGPAGLFPRPLSESELSTPNGERVLHLFKTLGKFVARSMIDSRIIDIHFNPVFFRIGETTSSGVKPSLASVKMVDAGLARSLMAIKNFALAKKEIDEDPSRAPAQKVADLEKLTIDGVRLEDLCLDFTLPGYPGIELEEGGSQKRVTIDNVESYLEKVVDVTLESGVRRQVDAFRAGFSAVFPYSALSAFTPDELVNLFGKADEDWSLETLLDSMKADHGYNMDSASVRNLLHLMSEFTVEQRRDFLQFTTGSPKLPIGGFKSLTPMFTVVRKPSEEPYTSDDYLPSVMTCVNYLKLPDYSGLEAMRKQLTTAMKEGQGAFHLS
ncbi:uncharacterized protein F5Z01DRAFT_672051 [Emericellopsis atlantica]|uniref:HECT-type E3 ubiquitin transferase n=1 Tax=Emericellopsis atlantica TaxID=2614577 RepID=A0A9P7ZSF8_9HYPO|nr:uncharacterized protein F5Z01DRAFT_672051 [Emericellopsis atlantica]KAG9256818.1 hypothetical protein F5Z01DRAFT_672051 [Emericellopsis atlantica]